MPAICAPLDTKDVEAANVVVSVPNARLGRALEQALSDLLPGFTVETGEPEEGTGAIVVATPGTCSLLDCRRLVKEGTRVILISPTAMVAERRLYEEAGAFAYFSMQIETTNLIANAVRLAAGTAHSPERASRTTASHELSPRPC